MNNVNDIEATPDFIADQRQWLAEFKASTGFSWSKLEGPVGRPGSTLSAFCGATYNGDNAAIAKQVYRYRQTLATQAQLSIEAPDIPLFFETRMSRELMSLLTWAQRGRMAACVSNPGMSKTETAKEYKERANNVTLVTCRKSVKTLMGLCTVVLAAMGDKGARGSSERLSQWVMTNLRNSGGLLIFDDAQHLTLEFFEEIRGWYDQTQTGIAYLGNNKIIGQMEGGNRSDEYAQIFSRIGMKKIWAKPYEQDVEALASAWQVEDDRVVALLKDIAAKPGALRTCTFALEIATTIARANGEALERKHLADAWAQLSSRPVNS